MAWELSRGGSCEGVWLGFASHGPAEPEWLSCEKIRSASRNDDSLSSPDFAILELRDETTRAPLELGRDALDAGEVVWMVSVTADRFYDNEHLVRSRRCVVDANPDMTPWAPTPSPEVRVLSSCPIHLGNSGAPLLDRRGRMRGLVHAGGPPFFAFGLMTGSERLPESGRGARLD